VKAQILNYGVGNIFSLASALTRAGFQVTVNEDLVNDVDLVAMPGVGAFSAVSASLERLNSKLNEMRERGIYFLGVCLGMQVMFQEGTEGGRSKGLGWLKGRVERIRGDVKLPHIGWDRVRSVNQCELTEGLDGKYFYFVHSYIAKGVEGRVVKLSSFYGEDFPALVCEGNLVGTQFHPEKSSQSGRIFFHNLRRWMKR
jgi:glutamine amidotransferase